MLPAQPSQRSVYENETKALPAVNPNTKFPSAASVLARSFQLAFSHRSHYTINKKIQKLSHMHEMMNDGNTVIRGEGSSLTSLRTNHNNV